jgi:hypothetical protein
MFQIFSGAVAGVIAFGLLFSPVSVIAQTSRIPTIAVTDLSYEQSVRSHFAFLQANSNMNAQANAAFASIDSTASINAASGDIVQISRGEMHQFTGDIKGGLLKTGAYKLIQGRPWTKSDTTTIPSACIPPKCDGTPSTFSETVTLFDVIDRIKKNYYVGADFVLFGTVSSIEGRNDRLAIQGSNAMNLVYSIELTAEFSLINTKTFEVVAAFSAIGQGNDSRLINSGSAVMTASKGRVIRDVSRSLGEDVTNQILEQFGQMRGGNPAATRQKQTENQNTNSTVTEYK